MIFEVGTKFIITDKPRYWNGELCKKCPFFTNIEYPYYGTILAIKKQYDGEIAMTDGIYGWSLTTLIEENKIEISLKEERRIKLKKLWQRQNA